MCVAGTFIGLLCDRVGASECKTENDHRECGKFCLHLIVSYSFWGEASTLAWDVVRLRVLLWSAHR